MKRILNKSGYDVLDESGKIVLRFRGQETSVDVYPAMWATPKGDNAIHISDACLKYAKPYALQKIKDVLS